MGSLLVCAAVRGGSARLDGGVVSVPRRRDHRARNAGGRIALTAMLRIDVHAEEKNAAATAEKKEEKMMRTRGTRWVLPFLFLLLLDPLEGEKTRG